MQHNLRNYNACLHGYHGCDQSKLTDVEQAEVQKAARQRNYNACLHGHYGCDQSKLTDSQQTEAQPAASRRNYNACLVAIMVATSQSLPMWSERNSSKQPRRETSPLASMAILAVISLD
jgi:hypothetical protein